ncbi:MAG: phosphoribosylanthranilate isomerase [Oscillospiraceae bacterium]|nr:phosphoribosylanthranilate isomerase [Oscillospiraceae bacterium]
MNPRLKICGIRRIQDVEYLNLYVPDYAGFILSKPFWRYVSPEQMQILHEALHPGIRRVGVFVNPELYEIRNYARFLDVIQLHGEESGEFIKLVRKNFPVLEIWKAVRVRNPEDIHKADLLPVDQLVLDSFSEHAHGGTGTLAPWDVIVQNRPEKEFFLAGGISANNIRDAVREVRPFGIDVSSSVETDKCKDVSKIREILEILQNRSDKNDRNAAG